MATNFFKRLVFGTAKDPLDPSVFQKLSLAAVLAWVGLGADGLSSSCYGPEEAFKALGSHQHLALFLAVFIALTVFTISAGYSRILDQFPTGGGGYLVATQLLGRPAGLVAGGALMIDYVLTISISVASGVDALFSFLPSYMHAPSMILNAKYLIILVLLLLNLRGVRESIMVLLPIFFLFLATHAVIILYGIFSHGGALPHVLGDTVKSTYQDLGTNGFWTVFVVFMTAFSLGGGTFTGIEAVSNSVQILKEPRGETGKRTMRYMAWSLALTAGGILLCYLLLNVHGSTGKTLNAVMIGEVTEGWGGAGHVFLIVALISEGALLFVAAQSGFVAGPRVLASMALDSWVPRQFIQISDRLVIRNGILVMGMVGLAILYFTGGSVQVLVIMYSVNVFIGFVLSQLGMCLHWIRTRHEGHPWKWSLFINATACLLSAILLVLTTALKFQGAWIALAMTGGFMLLCLGVRHHYHLFSRWTAQLDKALMNVTLTAPSGAPATKDSNRPTAVLMVSGYNGLGIHSLLTVHRLFPGYFHNFVFVSVGVLDSGTFKGTREVERLRAVTEEGLIKYVDLAKKMGFYAESRYHLGVDPVQEVENVCLLLRKEFPNAMYFSGRLVFPEEGYLEKVLHNQTALTLQGRFHFNGMPLMVLPIKVR